MSVRELLKLLAQDGWTLARQSGSHRQFKHPIKSGTVTVAGHPKDEIHPKTLASIKKQSGLS